jgi:hypothetical protein
LRVALRAKRRAPDVKFRFRSTSSAFFHQLPHYIPNCDRLTIWPEATKAVNAIVPYEVAGSAQATVQVLYGGSPVPSWSVPVVAAAPSVFTVSDAPAFEEEFVVINVTAFINCHLLLPHRNDVCSDAIGKLLAQIILVNETRSLIAGEAVAGPIMEELHRVLAADSRILQIDEIATMHLGPQAILMALTLRCRSDLSIPALDDAIREITFTLQSVEKRVAYVYVRP